VIVFIWLIKENLIALKLLKLMINQNF